VANLTQRGIRVAQFVERQEQQVHEEAPPQQAVSGVMQQVQLTKACVIVYACFVVFSVRFSFLFGKSFLIPVHFQGSRRCYIIQV
jgi:hypothetical protein